MLLNKLRLDSIKVRVTLFTLTSLVISLWLLSFNASRKLEQEMIRQIDVQQMSATNMLANEINNDLDERLTTLEKISEKIGSIGLENPQVLNLFLDDRFVIRRDYNAGAYITNTNGKVIAAVSECRNKIGLNVSTIDSVNRALHDGKSSISSIVEDITLNHQQTFHFAAAINDRQGKVIGTLVGVIELNKPSFLDKIVKNHYGKNGYYLLQDNQSSLIISSSDHRHLSPSDDSIMHNTDQALGHNQKSSTSQQPGLNPGTQSAPVHISKSDAHHEAFKQNHSNGANNHNLLISTKSIPLADWVIVSALPKTEAFTPIREMQYRMMMNALLITIVLGALTWWLLRRELFPMFSTISKISTLTESGAESELPTVKNSREINALIHAFNYLLQELKQREHALKESEFRWKFAIEGAGDGLWDWDIKTNRVFYSLKWKRQLGYNDDDISDSVNEWETRIHPEDKVGTFEAVKDHFEGKTPFYSFEHRLRCKDGSYKWILTRGLVVSRDNEGHPLRAIGTHTDITQSRNLTENMRRQALYDPLTQLPNRRLFEDHLSQAIAASRRYNNYGALLFLDLDNFKPLNDTHGHEMGDLLLIEVANRLKKCVRETDTVARIGGDEFVVALPQLYVDEATSTQQGMVVAEKIRAALAKPYQLKNIDDYGHERVVEHHCTASIGFTLFKGDHHSVADILRHADEAMYQAKNAGRNRVCNAGIAGTDQVKH